MRKIILYHKINQREEFARNCIGLLNLKVCGEFHGGCTRWLDAFAPIRWIACCHPTEGCWRADAYPFPTHSQRQTRTRAQACAWRRWLTFIYFVSSRLNVKSCNNPIMPNPCIHISWRITGHLHPLYYTCLFEYTQIS